MIQFEKFILENGLRVIVHQDNATPMVAVNVLYDVGARDENPEMTGFAHLFEHLMFGGSINIPEYDTPLQMAGGENNAYTTNDLTNYYIQLPKQNIETALWLESDRMLSLAFSKKSLDVQRKVVCEEFKEHYINKPYGDAWKHLRSLAYTQHPYQWMTIGKELKHVEDAKLEDVKNFFQKHYNPSNAILCIAGDISIEEAKNLSNKWFGNIPSGIQYVRNLPTEPAQLSARTETLERDVPIDALYKAWHIPARSQHGYHECDLITEIMGNGYASRLYQSLVKEQQIFSNINCYHTGSLDAGLLVIEGKINKEHSLDAANEAINAQVEQLLSGGISATELAKAQNKIEAMISFEDMNLLSRANNLAFYELLGDASLINKELSQYQSVTTDSLMKVARHVFRTENANTLFYKANKTATKN
ncbi:MAG: insulinase family protein [Chitinophagaceae bacterium]|nr:insulinase family protein [Chitinophagaceae bacterium]